MTSADGITWTRVTHDETVFGTGDGPDEPLMLSVAAGGPGLVAVGAQSPGKPKETPVWTSPDGFTWTRVPDDETFRGFMTSVTTGGPGLVVVGRHEGDVMVLTSVDGVTWSRVPHDEAVFGGGDHHWMSAVTVGGPGLVAVGNREDDAAVWVWVAATED